MERANRTLGEGLEGEERSNFLELERIVVRLRRWDNEERLNGALSYLRPLEFYCGDPPHRFEKRRVKLFQTRHRRREKKLILHQETLPLKGGEAVSSDRGRSVPIALKRYDTFLALLIQVGHQSPGAA